MGSPSSPQLTYDLHSKFLSHSQITQIDLGTSRRVKRAGGQLRYTRLLLNFVWGGGVYVVWVGGVSAHRHFTDPLPRSSRRAG